MHGVGRNSDVAVQNSFTQLFRQLLHALGCQCHWQEKRQEKMLHPAILTKGTYSDKKTPCRAFVILRRSVLISTRYLPSPRFSSPAFLNPAGRLTSGNHASNHVRSVD